MSLRDSILSAQDITTQPFTSSFWKDSQGKFVALLVRGISQERRRQLVKDCTATVWNEGEKTETVDNDKLAIAVIIECVLDPSTETPVFQPEDRDAILRKSAPAVEELAGAVMNATGFGSPRVTEKNSERTDSVASPSVSQSASDAPSESSTKA